MIPKLKISTLIFFVCFLFQNSYSQQNINGWYWINGQPQSNYLHWVKILDATHYYAVGENGTFMKSSDGGDSWLINSQAGVTETALDTGATNNLYSAWFFDANTGIVAGQSNFNDDIIIRRTTNAGQTFSSIRLGTASGSGRVFDIYFINSTTGYLCGNTPVKAFKTTNAGLNWTLLPNLPADIPYNCVYAKDQNNIFLGAATEGSSGQRRIVRTTNAGTTWKIDTLPGSVIVDIEDIEFQNSNTGFVCGNSVATNPSYFAFTTNGGSNWTEAAFPNKEHGLYDLKVVGSKVYALGASFNSYHSTSNLGLTWDSVTFNDATNINQPQWFVYAFDINASDAIVVGALGKVNISNDGGSSWRNKNYSVGNSNYCFSSVFALRGTQKVWAGASGGGTILYSSNGGVNWNKQQTSAGESFEEIEMINSNTGYAVGGSLNPGSGYCFKTTNGGTNWTKLTILNPVMPRYGLCFINATTGWIFGGYPFGSTNQINKTTNGGATWVDQPMIPTHDKTIEDGDMENANTGYCTFSDNVYKTINGGTNWTKINNIPPSYGWKKVQTFPNSTVYLGGNQRIFKSTNGGNTWDSVKIPNASASIFNMDWTDLNNGTVVGTLGYTAKTTNGGITWTERNTGTSTLQGVSMASKDTVFATCDRNVYGAMFRLIDINNSISINLTMAIEGFWNGTAHVSDNVTCHLRNSTAPFNEVEAVTTAINNSGNGTFNFNSAPSGSYYIEITHRNSIETWSSVAQAFSHGGSYNYNFTTSASQAFGNNLIEKSGRFCNYSGDVNQDDAVNLTDLLDTYNASSNFVTGYVVTDVNGDNTVDLSDITVIYNNTKKFVTKVAP